MQQCVDEGDKHVDLKHCTNKQARMSVRVHVCTCVHAGSCACCMLCIVKANTFAMPSLLEKWVERSVRYSSGV